MKAEDPEVNNSNIILENEAFCLTLGADAHPVSLIVKKSGEEMLAPVEAPRVSMFSVTEERSFRRTAFSRFPRPTVGISLPTLRRRRSSARSGKRRSDTMIRINL